MSDSAMDGRARATQICIVHEFLPSWTMRKITAGIAGNDAVALSDTLAPPLLEAAPEAAARCGVEAFDAHGAVVGLLVLNNADGLPRKQYAEAQSSARLAFCYFVPREPKRFSGGALHIWPTGSSERGSEWIVDPAQNTIVFYPAAAEQEIARVSVPTRRAEDSLIVLRGHICASVPG